MRPLIGISISLVLAYLVLFSPHLLALFSGKSNLLDALFGDPRISVADLRTLVHKLVPGYALVVGTLLSLAFFLRAWRWRLILRQIGFADYWTVYHGVTLGYLLNNVLPLRAGELLRAVIVGQRCGLSRTAVFTTVVVERVFDLAGLGVVFGMVTYLFPFPGWLQAAGLSFATAVVVILLISWMLAHSRERLQRWHLAVERRGLLLRRTGETVLKLVDGLPVLKSTGAMIHMVWSTLGLWVIYIAAMKFTLDAFQFTSGVYPELAGHAWLPSCALTVITSLGFAIPSAPGGVGTYHGAVLLGLSWFDVPEGMAVLFATAIHALNYLITTLVGLISMLAMRLRFSEIIHTAKVSSDSSN